MRKTWLALAFASALAPGAAAQTQLDLNDRAQSRYLAADRELNRTYGALRARLSPTAAALLRDAQRLWIDFRDAECRLRISGLRGGSASPMIYAQCREELTRLRTRQLNDYLTCPEGSMDCPR